MLSLYAVCGALTPHSLAGELTRRLYHSHGVMSINCWGFWLTVGMDIRRKMPQKMVDEG